MALLKKNKVYFTIILNYCLNCLAFRSASVTMKSASNISLPEQQGASKEDQPTKEPKDELRRIKRQSGGGMFTDAAKMSQMKLLRVWLQMFSNLASRSPIGGSHPFHISVPGPFVHLFKTRLYDFFFPEVGDQKVAY